MIISAARLAAGQMFQRDFRGVLWKSLGLTLLLLIAVWIGLEALISVFLAPLLGPWPWVSTAMIWLMGAGMLVGAGFLIGPVAAIFAGIFMDDIADKVEKAHYPHEEQGTALPLLPSIWLSARFAVVVIAANLVALALVLLPGINLAVFFLVNAYLLGREYFQFAAMRFRSHAEAEALRRDNSLPVFLAGLIIAGFMAVPLLNLLTPLFATAMMVHVHKAVSSSRPRHSPAAHGRLAA